MSTETTTPKFPDVIVDLGNLAGPDGNAFAVMGKVTGALKRAKKGSEAVNEYTNLAMSGDYNNLLRVTTETVSVVVSQPRYSAANSLSDLGIDED